jgi:hypothetical protein
MARILNLNIPGEKAVRMGFNAHRSTGPLGNAIARVTAPFLHNFSPKRLRNIPSHISIVWELASGRQVIYEALEGKGWRGPIDMADVLAWAQRKEKRWVRTHWIPTLTITPEDATRKLHVAHARLRTWKYSTIQLPRMGIRKYWDLPMKPTPNDVVCSEAASIFAAPEIDIPMLCGKPAHDFINPYQFEQAICRYLYTDTHKPVDVSDAYTK